MSEDIKTDGEFNIEKETQPPLFRFQSLIIPLLVFILYMIIMIIVFVVPKKWYDNGKKEHATAGTPSKTLICLFWLLEIFFGIFLSLLINLIMECKKPSELPSHVKTTIIIVFNISCYGVIGTWTGNLIVGLCDTYNPANVLNSKDIVKYVNMSVEPYLMGYVYGYGKYYKTQRYSSPYLFKISLTDYGYEEFDETTFPDIYSFRLNYNNTFDQKIEENLEKGLEAVEKDWNKDKRKLRKLYFGVYPDFQELYYASKTGKLTGKYSQGSRVSSIVFGASTYYEYAIKALPHIEIGINRTLVCSSEDPKFDEGGKLFDDAPNLDAYYNELYS